MHALSLALVRAVGPYFAIDEWTPDDAWLPLTQLVTDPSVVIERVEVGRATLSTTAGLSLDDIEERAAASIVFLGLASRLISPALAAAVLADEILPLELENLWWKPTAAGPWPIALSSNTRKGKTGDVGLDRLISGVLTPLLDAFSSIYSLSPQVMWGNVASSLAGALTMLIAAEPDRSDEASALVERVLAAPTLSGSGSLHHPWREDPQRFFVRNSCCLFYRMPGAGTCGDCVLVSDDDRWAQWRAALASPR